MSTFLLGTFLTAETKGKFTSRRSDFSIFHVAFLDRYFDSILANHVESFFCWLFHIKYVIFDVLVSDLLCFHWPRRSELKSFRKKGSLRSRRLEVAGERENGRRKDIGQLPKFFFYGYGSKC